MEKMMTKRSQINFIFILFLTITVLSIAETQAVQAADTYMITASADTHSKIDPTGLALVNYGSTQTYRYSANTGYVMTSVSVDGKLVAITGNYIFTNIISNHTIDVKASIINYTINSSCDSHSTINPSGALQVAYGSSTTFTYSANTGYMISQIAMDGHPVSIMDNYTFTNVTDNHSIAITTVALPPTPTQTPTPTPKPSPTPSPIETQTPTPTPSPTSNPDPAPQPTAQPTQPSTPNPAITPQQTNPTPKPSNQPTIDPTTKPTHSSTPNSTEKPKATTVFTNIIAQNDLFTGGIAAAVIMSTTLVIAAVIRRRQLSSDSFEEEFDG
jgi:hypothetical protein